MVLFQIFMVTSDGNTMALTKIYHGAENNTMVIYGTSWVYYGIVSKMSKNPTFLVIYTSPIHGNMVLLSDTIKILECHENTTVNSFQYHGIQGFCYSTVSYFFIYNILKL